MTLHEIKQRLQGHLSDGLVLVVGSGLSCAEGLPGMGELGSHLRSSVPAALTGDDVAAWSSIAALIGTKGLEGALLEQPPSQEIEARIVTETGNLVLAREKAVIEQVFSGRTTLRITKLIKHLLKPNTGLPIITTNYDRLVEIGLEEAGVGVDTLFTGRFAGTINEVFSRFSFCTGFKGRGKAQSLTFRNRAMVYKPHGSLDWYLRNGKPVCYGGELGTDVPRLIITPGRNKFRTGYDSPFDVHRSRANDAIDKASRFLILGYGFNDDHLETHLSPAIRQGKPTLMMTFELTQKARAMALELPSVIAMDRTLQDGIEGTRIIADRTETILPHQSLWDVNHFIREVL
ncbi:MAG: SIR2 family protein [Fibrobacterota bacterium]|nr:MAG: SIR2 family protein [Fibrobacterota bacterium]